MDSGTAREDLLRELEADGDEYFDGGRTNNIIDLCLSIAAIVASLAATVLAGAGDSVLPWFLATVAALPAAFSSIQTIIDVRGRSSWYFRHAARVRALAVSLKYAVTPSVEDFARKRAELEVEMENEWSTVGRLGISPSKPKKE